MDSGDRKREEAVTAVLGVPVSLGHHPISISEGSGTEKTTTSYPPKRYDCTLSPVHKHVCKSRLHDGLVNIIIRCMQSIFANECL